MKSSKLTQIQTTNRIGFHYFPDTTHYTYRDLTTWLPELKRMNATSLILLSDATRAIPEHFISALIGSGITPIVHIPLNLPDAPNPADIKTILEVYARWGVEYVIFFDKPNSRSSWTTSGWAQQDLVERFLDKYIPLANLALQSGLTPIFPPLEPGGSYWDTTFLRTALLSIIRRKQTALTDHLILSAYAFTYGKDLNWGAGGPQKWTQNRPYYTPMGSEDQRGFRIFEWYEAIAQETLQRDIPVLLLGAGIKNQEKDGSYDADQQVQVTKEILSDLTKAVQGDTNAIPAYVESCAFYLLAADPASERLEFAWFPAADQPRPVVQLLATQQSKPEEQTAAPQIDPDQEKSLPENDPSHPINHYLLLPVYEWGVADWHLDAIKPFVKKYQPTVGYSLKEALLAQAVTVVGGEQTFPQQEIQKLIESGCRVERISGDGTTIATLLAER